MIELFKDMLDFHAQRDSWFSRGRADDQAITRVFASRIGDPSCVLLVAERDGQVVGYAHGTLRQQPQIFLHRAFGEVNEVAVDRNYQDQGVGTELFKRLLQWFTAKGIRRIEARVAISNEVSTRFWRKLGFTPYTETLVLRTPGPDGHEENGPECPHHADDSILRVVPQP